jgi:methylated-DNA-[protein]-cysteine S-methyltransferase
MSNIETRDPGAELRRRAVASPADAERAGRRFSERADAEGLFDVAYAGADSPFGPLVLATTERGLVRIGLPNQSQDEVLEELAGAISPRVLELPSRLDRAQRELELYFEGRLQRFDLPLDWRLSHGFRRKVLRETARLPYGGTATYAEMAARAGSARAFRAAGSALGSNPIPIVVPCHRVLRTGGNLGGYGGGLEMKQALLRLEGALE